MGFVGAIIWVLCVLKDDLIVESLESDFVKVKFGQALEAHEAKSLQIARKLYNEVIVADDTHAEAHNNLATLLQDEGLLEEAEKHYRAALEHNKNFHDAAFNLGMFYQDNGMLNEAVGLYKHCLRISPDRLDAWINLGTSFHALGDIDRSIFAYQKTLEKAKELEDGEGKGTWLDDKVLSSVNEHLGRALLRKRDQLLASTDSVDIDSEKLTSEAVEYLSAALKLDATNEIARHMMMANLNSLAREEQGEHAVDLEGTASSAPEEYVRKLFDDYSESFEASLNNLDYRAPQLIMESLSSSLRDSPAVVVDLGCGTGLLGPLFTQDATLIGVDLSSKMLYEAEKKAKYDYLVDGDIVKFLWLMKDLMIDRQFAPLKAVPRRKFSGSSIKSLEVLEQQGGLDDTFPLTRESSRGTVLYAAADVLVYIGDLKPLFDALAAVVRKGDSVVFTIENADAIRGLKNKGAGWVLQSTGRYAHHLAYIEAVLAQDPCKDRLNLVSVVPVVPRRELDRDIQGYLIILDGVK